MYLNAAEMTFSSGEGAERVPNDFYISKLIEQYGVDFEIVNPSSEISDIVDDYIEQREAELKNKLSAFGPLIREHTWEALSPDRSIEMYSDMFLSRSNVLIYEGEITNNVVIGYISLYDGGGVNRNYIRLVSKTKKDCNNFLTFLNEEVESLSSLVGEFVKLDSIKFGDDLVREDLNNNDEIISWETDEPENGFEKEVQSKVQNLVGPCLENVEVKFESGNNEYDIITMPMGREGNKFAVEVKDFEKVKEQISEEERESELSADNLQSKLINQPKISAERSNLQLIMVVNEIPNETYENLLRQANPLGVTLLNGNNYEEGLEEQLINESIKMIHM